MDSKTARFTVEFCDWLTFSFDCRADEEKWNDIQLYFIYSVRTGFIPPPPPYFPPSFIWADVLGTFAFTGEVRMLRMKDVTLLKRNA